MLRAFFLTVTLGLALQAQALQYISIFETPRNDLDKGARVEICLARIKTSQLLLNEFQVVGSILTGELNRHSVGRALSTEEINERIQIITTYLKRLRETLNCYGDGALANPKEISAARSNILEAIQDAIEVDAKLRSL